MDLDGTISPTPSSSSGGDSTRDLTEGVFEQQHTFTELLQESRSRLYGYLFALVRNASDADDLFQATAAILWQKFDSFEKDTNFTAWATKVGNLVYRNFARRNQRKSLLLSEEALCNLTEVAALGIGPGSTPRMEALNNCLDGLSTADRDLLKMCYEDQRKMKDIASEQGRTHQAVYSSMARIRRALAACVERRLSVDCH